MPLEIRYLRATNENVLAGASDSLLLLDLDLDDL